MEKNFRSLYYYQNAKHTLLTLSTGFHCLREYFVQYAYTKLVSETKMAKLSKKNSPKNYQISINNYI